jgi:hypothetical protein
VVTAEAGWRTGEGGGAWVTRRGAAWLMGGASVSGGVPTSWPHQDSAGQRGSNSVLNRFKNIQTVQMKFEFLQILTGSKNTFLCSKNLK